MINPKWLNTYSITKKEIQKLLRKAWKSLISLGHSKVKCMYALLYIAFDERVCFQISDFQTYLQSRNVHFWRFHICGILWSKWCAGELHEISDMVKMVTWEGGTFLAEEQFLGFLTKFIDLDCSCNLLFSQKWYLTIQWIIL